MLIYVNPSSGVPVYRQIVDQVKRLIAAAQLAPGGRLDSVRELAGRLGVNPMTVAKAYAVLAAEGVVVTRPGSGVYVAAAGRDELTAAARRRLLADLLDQVVAEAHQLGVGADDAVELLAERFAHSPAPPSAADPREAARSESPAAARPPAPSARTADEPPNEPAPSPPPPGAEEEDVALL